MGITLRSVQGSALTHDQADENFSSLIYSASLSGTNLTLHYTSSEFAPDNLVISLPTSIGPQGPAGPQGPPGPQGPAGPRGPQGPIGINGTSSYTWIKYADGPNGDGINDYPFKPDGTAREYIGIAYNKKTPTESDNPKDYVWTKYIGDQGIPGESVLSSIVFKRSADVPATPTGGTYLNPIPEGWSDGIPEESNGNPVWMSTRVFTLSGNAPQESEWSKPQITSDTATLDIDWSSSDVVDPGTPDEPKNGAVWEETSSTSSIWMAMQRIVNGKKKPWEVKRIKGEKGESSYMWIKYSKYPLGRDTNGTISMFDTPFIMKNGVREDMVYIGIAYNKQTKEEADPNTPEGAPEQYAWTKIKGEDGPQGPQGPQGINGTSGPTPRLLEFVEGASYENGGLYIDYAYYRSNDDNEGWYTVKLPIGHTPGTVIKQVYAGGIPDRTKFDKAPFTKEMSFGTVLAEQANLAGFIFRNQVLYSQTGANNSSCHPSPGAFNANLSLNGLQGVIKFLDRMVLDRNGITLNDDCGKPRMVFQWNNTTGIPVLKFLDENGVTTWEAGKSGIVTITEGTTKPSWTNTAGFRRIVNLPMSESISFGDASNGHQAGNENAMIVRALTDSLIFQEDPANPGYISRTHDETKPVWFVQNAMPSGHQYTTDHSNNFFDNTGYAEFYNKGDIAANSKHYEGYYITRNPIEIGQEVGNPNLIPDGWYLIEGISGANAAQLMSSLVNPNLQIFGTNVVYMKNGNISNTVWVPLYKYYSS